MHYHSRSWAYALCSLVTLLSCQQARVAGSFLGFERHSETAATARTTALPLRWYDAEPPCPDDAELHGRLPPVGEKMWCERPGDQPHGLYSRWWSGGQRREEGGYCRGRRHGPWTRWNQQGQRLSSEWLACGRLLRKEQRRDGRWQVAYDHRDRKPGFFQSRPPVCHCPAPSLPSLPARPES